MQAFPNSKIPAIGKNAFEETKLANAEERTISSSDGPLKVCVEKPPPFLQAKSTRDEGCEKSPRRMSSRNGIRAPIHCVPLFKNKASTQALLPVVIVR